MAKNSPSDKNANGRRAEDGEERIPRPVPKAASKTMSWSNGRVNIGYVATAETIPCKEDGGEPIGDMFALSYVSDVVDKADRAVTFCFNGGPGCASVLINVGGIGPLRIPSDRTNHLPCPTLPTDNPYSLLSLTDLVFLDAFGTGYSTLAPGYDPKKVWGIDGDADSFARAIAGWLSKHDRWDAPLYLYGESYGTMRNAVLMRLLGERGIGVTGVIEQSTILDYAPKLSGNDLYYMGMLPVYASTAQYYGKSGAGIDPVEFFNSASEFVDNIYGAALIKSDRITDEEEAQAAEQMASFIGLDADFLRKNHLRIELDDFRKMIIADAGKFTGRYDTRFTEYSYMEVQSDTAFFADEDPSLDAVNSDYISGWLKHVNGIGYKGSPNFVSYSTEINNAWNWHHQPPATHGSPQCPNTAYDIATALRRNPRCRMIFFGGLYDAATPFWNVTHAMSKLFLPKKLKNNIEYHLYGCGHMSYIDDETLPRMWHALRNFYELRHTAREG